MNLNSTCIFCHGQEPHSQDLVICSDCIQYLLSLDRDQMNEFRAKCIEKDQTDKIELLERII